MGIERPDWGGDGNAPPDPSPPAVVPQANGQITRSDWHYWTHQVPAPAAAAEAPKEQIVAGVGYAPSLIEKFKRTADGFEANDARLVEAAADFLERSDAPREVMAAFDALPVSLQTKAYDALWANPSASLEQLYGKLKGKATLSEAAALERAWQSLA